MTNAASLRIQHTARSSLTSLVLKSVLELVSSSTQPPKAPQP
jgi:hypothetical protein